MLTLTVVVQFVLGVLISIAVLLQKSSSVGLGAYSGSNESVFGAKGAGGFLAKTTAVLGVLFVINTVVLTYLYSHKNESSLTDNIKIEQPAPSSQTPPSPPAVPQAPSK